MASTLTVGAKVYSSIPITDSDNIDTEVSKAYTITLANIKSITKQLSSERFNAGVMLVLDCKDASSPFQRPSKTDMENLCGAIQKARSIVIFVARNIDLESAQTSNIVDALRANGIRKIEFYNCKLGDRVGELFAGLLKENHHALQHLTLRHSGINNTGLEAIGKALRGNNKLRVLDLSGNYTNERTLQAFIATLRVNATVKDLHFSTDGTTHDALKLIETIFSVQHIERAKGIFSTTLSRQAPILVSAARSKAKENTPRRLTILRTPSLSGAVKNENDSLFSREAQMKVIQGNEALELYYHTFKILFQGTLEASGLIESGMVADARKNHLENIAALVKAVCSVCDVSETTKMVVDAVEKGLNALSDIVRAREVHKIASLFKGHDARERAERLAIELTLAQEQDLKLVRELLKEQVSTRTRASGLAAMGQKIVALGTAIKERLSHLIDVVKSKLYQNSADDPIVQKATRDFSFILAEILKADKNESSKLTIRDLVLFVCDVEIDDPISPRAAIEHVQKSQMVLKQENEELQKALQQERKERLEQMMAMNERMKKIEAMQLLSEKQNDDFKRQQGEGILVNRGIIKKTEEAISVLGGMQHSLLPLPPLSSQPTAAFSATSAAVLTPRSRRFTPASPTAPETSATSARTVRTSNPDWIAKYLKKHPPDFS